MTGIDIILILIFQIHFQLHQRPRCETISSSSTVSYRSGDQLIVAHLDLRNQPLETADESTSSACDLVNAVFKSDTSARARVDPTELTG